VNARARAIGLSILYRLYRSSTLPAEQLEQVPRVELMGENLRIFRRGKMLC
jgi:hypothetical protein